MISSDSKKLQIFAQHAGRVSRALWPVSVRRASYWKWANVAGTGKAARPSRRKGPIWTGNTHMFGRSGSLLNAVWEAVWAFGAIPLLLTITILAAALLLHAWYLMVILAIVFPALILVALFLSSQKPPRGSPNVQRSGMPMMARAPETPAPLIRILETFDLSQTDVEHFVAGPANGDATEFARQRSKDRVAV